MRSSKSRSRNKSNRPRPLGNIVNRVFDSSGPEGKVRGTPQQIIDKYLTLARDAQLSNDRVAEQSFLQHAEHYTRMLGEALREQAERQPPWQGGQQQGSHQQGGQQQGVNGHAQQNGNGHSREDGGEDDRARGEQRRQDDRNRDDRGRDDRNRDDRNRDDRNRDDRARDDRQREDRFRDDRRRNDDRSRSDREERGNGDADGAATPLPAAADALPDAIDLRASDEPVSLPEAAEAPFEEAAPADPVAAGQPRLAEAAGTEEAPAAEGAAEAQESETAAPVERAPRRRSTAAPRPRTPRSRKPAEDGEAPVPERAAGE